MENTLYYTLSTVAQTLAGAVALLGAFVFYRLQAFNAEISRLVTQQIFQRDFGERRHDLDDLFAKGEMTRFITLAEAGVSAAEVQHIVVPLTQLKQIVKDKTRLIKDFRASLALTVAVISLGVIGLAVTRLLTSSLPWSIFVLAIEVAGLLGCFFTYSRLLYKQLT